VGQFGEKFRTQREQRGLTLDAISNTTKISTRMLKALEDERFDLLPGGVFNKGFVRAYARQIGLDPEIAVSDYLEALRDSQAQAQAIMPEFRPQRTEAAEEPKPAMARTISAADTAAGVAEPASSPGNHSEAKIERPPERVIKDLPPRKVIEERPAKPKVPSPVQIPWGMVALGLLVVALLLAGLSYRPHTSQQASSQPVTVPPQTQGASRTAAQGSSAQPSTASASAAAPASPAPSSSTPAASVTTAPSTSNPPAPNILSAASSNPSKPVQPPAPTSVEKASDDSDASAPLIHPDATPASATTRVKTTELSLLIRAEENSWVTITADGQPVAQETLIAPAGKSVRATQEIVVHAGNAGGLVFELNGKTLPKQGEAGEVRTFVFDAQGMRVIVPPAAAAQ
jgi:hypothetical protein